MFAIHPLAPMKVPKGGWPGQRSFAVRHVLRDLQAGHDSGYHAGNPRLLRADGSTFSFTTNVTGSGDKAWRSSAWLSLATAISVTCQPYSRAALASPLAPQHWQPVSHSRSPAPAPSGCTFR